MSLAYPTAHPDFHRLLAFARELQRTVSFHDMLELVRREIEETSGFRHAWFCVLEPDLKHARIVAFAGDAQEAAWEHAAIIPVEGDAMMEEILRASGPVVVEDARTDPRTNKQIVGALGNRTIVNVPLQVIDAPLGAIGIGTFGDEGCRLPTPEQLEYLVAMATQVSVAIARVRWLAERAAAQREQQKLQQQLFVSQKLESLGLLAGGVAHDFNNLLTAITAYGEIVSSSLPENDALQEPMAEIAKAAQRAAALTKQLLAFSRRQAVAARPVDLNAVVVALLGMLRRLIGEDVILDFRPGQSLGTVVADTGQLEQVVTNLVVNARDAMPSGGRLELGTASVLLDDDFVHAHPKARPGAFVRLSVKDSGCGMSPETLAHIFEPFFTTKAAGRGTGLGLATVYGIVNQQLGFVDVDSEPGRGTTVRVYLPRGDSPAHAENKPVATAAVGGTETILLAEDDPAILRLARNTLERRGYRVLPAADGRVAAELAAKFAGDIDLLITDVILPHLGGLKLAEQLRATRPRMAVLFMTGHPTSHLSTQTAAAFGETLAKPFTLTELSARARATLNARASAAGKT